MKTRLVPISILVVALAAAGFAVAQTKAPESVSAPIAPAAPAVAAPAAPTPAAAAPAAAAASARNASDLPPNARPGECYARIVVAPEYRTVSDKVVKRAESERVDIVPAKYAVVDEKVMVKAASKRIEVVPAVLEWAEERVMVKPESKRVEQVPAVFETVTERVLVKPATQVWQKGKGPIQKIDAATGDIMCLVEVPAVYQNVTKRVVKTPASTREIEIPAEYKLVKVTKLVEPAKEVKTTIPAEYQTITKTEKVNDGRIEWRSILCETNMTKDRIRDIQRALQKAGFNPGPIDGIISKQTMAAVNAYQKSKGLPIDTYLNIDTVRALGVNPA